MVRRVRPPIPPPPLTHSGSHAGPIGLGDCEDGGVESGRWSVCVAAVRLREVVVNVRVTVDDDGDGHRRDGGGGGGRVVEE